MLLVHPLLASNFICHLTLINGLLVNLIEVSMKFVPLVVVDVAFVLVFLI